MIDEIIAYAFDDDGNRHEMSLRDVYEQSAQMLKIMYFDGMIRGSNGYGNPGHHTKKLIMENVAVMLERIHDKYADHVEDARKQVFGKSVSLEGDTDG